MYSPPNRTYSSPSIRLSVVIVSLFISMNFVITFLANCDCFSLSGNHEFLPCFFAFQIFELADVYHFQIVLSSTIFTFMGFQASHKACTLHSIVIGHNVCIVNARFLVQPKPTMIQGTFQPLTFFVLLSYRENIVLTILVDNLSYGRFVL